MRKLPTIVHVDMDAFFASVEQMDKPNLVGKPVVVAGLGPRGVVATASYEARLSGVGSAMPTVSARRMCPQAAFISPRFDRYVQVSAKVMNIFEEMTELVEPVSVDEAFLDISRVFGSLVPTDSDVGDVLRYLRGRIKEEVGLNCSAGAATSKVVAKLASDAAKPNGQLVISVGGELEFMHPMPVRKLGGVGPATQRKLAGYGVETIGDLFRMERVLLTKLLGASAGQNLYALCRGEDNREIVVGQDRKSVGASVTFPEDVFGRDAIAKRLLSISNETCDRMASIGVVGKTISIKVRVSDFSSLSRAVTLRAASCNKEVIWAAVLRLLDGLLNEDGVGESVRKGGVGVRTMGVTVSGLADHAQEMLPGMEAWVGLAEAGEHISLRSGQHVDEEATTTSWAIGADVRHPKMGRGWVTRVDGAWTSVRFSSPEYEGRGPVLVATAALQAAKLQEE